MSGGWFLERGGKYYGPFGTGKIRELLRAGKISKDILVAENKEGTGSRQIGEIAELFEGIGTTTRPQPARKEAAPVEAAPHKAAPHKAAPKEIIPSKKAEWYVVADEKSHGPYELSHLKTLLEAGKLKPETTVRKEGASKTIRLELLLPKPRSEPEEPSPHPLRVEPEETPKKIKKRYLIGGLVIAASLLVVFFFPGENQDENDNLFSRFKKRIDEKPSLRKMINEPDRPPPPFNEVVQNALRTGLFFSAGELQKHHLNDLFIYDEKTGPKNFGHLFPNIKREIRYTGDKSLSYTYLLDEDGLAFAVVVKGFPKYKLSGYGTKDFSASALPPLEKLNETVWRTRLTEEVVARAVWTRQEKDYILDYVCVVNEPADDPEP